MRKASKELFKRALRVLPGGVNSPVRYFRPYPFFASYGKGSRLYDHDGRSYLDYCMGYGALLLGHAPQALHERVRERLSRGTLYGVPTEEEVVLAEALCRLVPSAERVRLLNSGCEATLHAIRLARGYTGRKLIVKFEGCYHGAHDYVLVKAGSGASTFGIPTSKGIPEESVLNTVVMPYNAEDALEEFFSKKGGEVAAAIVEPIMCNAGLIPPKEGYLRLLRHLTEQHGALLILDEVVTGFRVGLKGAQALYGIEGDLITLGKALSGGLPFAALVGRREVMEELAPKGGVYEASTFSGNALSVAMALSILEIIEENSDLYYAMQRAREAITKGLLDAVREAHMEGAIRINGVAGLFQVFFTKEEVVDYASALKADRKKYEALFKALLKRGIFIPPSQFETCFLSASHDALDVQLTIEAMGEAIKEVAKG